MMSTLSCSFTSAWPLNWQQCLQDFLDSIYERRRSLESRITYQFILQQFFVRVSKAPDAVTRQDIDSYLRYRSRGTGPVASGTRNNRLAILTSFYKYSARYLVQTPAGEQPLLQKPVPTLSFRAGAVPHRYRALSEPEMAAIFAAIPETVQGKRDRALFLCYFLTTRRKSEILRLTWGDIERGILRDEQGHMREGYLYHFHAKGMHAQELDTAELPETAYRAIIDYLQASGRYSTMAPGDPLFIGHGTIMHPDKAYSGRNVLRRLKYYARQAGLDARRVTVHAWRHTAVARRLEAGQPPLSIMKVTRHKSMSAFFTYAEGLVGTADDTAQLLEKRFGHLSR
jgi:integrase